jgi:aminoglycoside/choline kinase family phosphotransferase
MTRWAIMAVLAFGGAAEGLGAGADAAAAEVPMPAQDGFIACPSQQDIEQYLATDGDLRPEGCRLVDIVAVETDAGRVCALDFGREANGVLDTLRDAAFPTTWWAACDAVAAQVR